MDQRNEIKIPNALVGHYLTAAQEVLGLERLEDVLQKTNILTSSVNALPDTLELSVSSGQFAQVNDEIEKQYPSLSRKILQRIGFRSFKNVIQDQIILLTPAIFVLKILPPRQRLSIILNSLIDTLEKMQPQFEISVEDVEGGLAFIDRTCPICIGRHSQIAVCHLNVGFLMGIAQWVLGQPITVIETHCCAKGDDHCHFELEIPT